MTQDESRARQHDQTPHTAPCGGFTLVEVITVLLIIGILSALIATRGNTLNSDLPARMSEVRAQLRYIQLKAMKSGASYLALQCSNSTYWAYDTATPSTYLLLPGEKSATISLTDKNMAMNAFTIAFDRFGIPYSGSPLAKLSTNATITITAGGQSDSLYVTPETGFVP
ncbi:MAG TPA: prepilin-type N-terminal cleavage/methylation domain-containing protein [Humidesulfovibrio sp.]|uniref:prepilin-type N-terminal cleavage/methylation domain-containing protein n=1 Tax=Humidesulfovibrio sp. TaxID=2910988 RepID=UPI002D01E476|nr:prepilin-type N-terminal cleavage/methylation domain-containing protein [Humidesulfovibrio sp.]HWR02518.1 prepilin-type N-terminal cleavage/methylation domain-containing protein [Humidesulfovibrio sp.]